MPNFKRQPDISYAMGTPDALREAIVGRKALPLQDRQAALQDQQDYEERKKAALGQMIQEAMGYKGFQNQEEAIVYGKEQDARRNKMEDIQFGYLQEDRPLERQKAEMGIASAYGDPKMRGRLLAGQRYVRTGSQPAPTGGTRRNGQPARTGKKADNSPQTSPEDQAAQDNFDAIVKNTGSVGAAVMAINNEYASDPENPELKYLREYALKVLPARLNDVGQNAAKTRKFISDMDVYSPSPKPLPSGGVGIRPGAWVAAPSNAPTPPPSPPRKKVTWGIE